MKKIFLIIILAITIAPLAADKYAGEIFRMGAGVENYALGNTGLTNSNTAALAYWNSAFITNNTSSNFEIMHAEEYEGLLQYDIIAATLGNKISVVLTRIGIDDIPLTAWNENTNRPYVYKNVNNSDIALFVGFTRNILGWNIGFTPKFAYRNVADESAFGFGLDLSSYYKFSQDWLVAFKLRDAFTTPILWSNDTTETVLPSIDLETAYFFRYPILNRTGKFIAATSIYTESRDESATHSFGIFSSDYNFGLSTNIHPNADFLLGYDVDTFTTGLRISYKNWFVNYAFKYNTELENSHRISMEFKI
jgi:hypothetical protein